jgi:Flp pilus assembly protein TadG
MQTAIRNRMNRKKGQAMVETALVLPFIILILLGIIDFGIMFNDYMIINNASRECARNAVVGMTDTSLGVLFYEMTPSLDPGKTIMKIEIPPGDRKKGVEITVTVTTEYDFLTPVIGAFMHGPITLKAQTVMRME